MKSIPPERAIFASYKLWRKHADPDGLISASEFAEMDVDDKREALRELGGAMPADANARDDDDDEENEDEEHDDDEIDDLPPPELLEGDDPLAGDVVELTDDVVDPRTADPYA
jgi:hypothetical protein